MATELAKAYVQIVPSARGIKGSLSQSLGGEASRAGAAAGHSIAGAIKGTLVTAGIGAALGKALTEGADLQQNIGGIETLFKESADIIKQRADEAYRTAGMSANKYMELTTGFSASLLQSLGGDTQKAADISDMAMTDMSDNANKMGTDLERITDAYQGFAKQNYTMLDNLKLGYGGTKTEMERLLKDAQKISGVKYSINNLSDVYEAIHVIQGEMEISGRTAEEAAEIYKRTGREVSVQMGTTAKEAATTLSGSLSAMKAAFSNVLGKLTLGQDVGPALNALAETTTTFLVGNLLPAVWNILKALPGALAAFVRTGVPQIVQGMMQFVPQLQAAIISGAPQLMAFAGKAVESFCQGFPQMLPKLLESGQQLLMWLVNGLVTALPQLAEMAINIVSTIITTLVENLPRVIEMGSKMLVQLVTGIAQSLPRLLSMAAQTVMTLLTGLLDHFPEILAAGFNMIITMIGGIKDAFPHILQAALEVAGKIWDTITETDWIQLGKDIIRGMIKGIGAMGGALWDAAKSIAKTALDAIKEFFGIASPSKVMRDQVGKWIPAGMAEGIRRNTEPVRRAMHSLTDITMDSLPQCMAMRLSPAGVSLPVMAGGHQTILNQTIYTHDSLSESELTRQAEDLLARQKWGIP